jgi:hypothetical protein
MGRITSGFGVAFLYYVLTFIAIGMLVTAWFIVSDVYLAWLGCGVGMAAEFFRLAQADIVRMERGAALRSQRAFLVRGAVFVLALCLLAWLEVLSWWWVPVAAGVYVMMALGPRMLAKALQRSNSPT